jgi:hypothetical protein
MNKWFKDILPDKDPYHNRGRDQMWKKGSSEIEYLWFSLGTLASSTTKTGRHDITEILLKVALKL